MTEFSGSMFDEEEDDSYHAITTDHKYMAQLGLSSFTTGTLYKWWNANDFKNRKLFPDILNYGLTTVPADLFFGYTAAISGVELFNKGTEGKNDAKYDKFTMLPIGGYTPSHPAWSRPSAIPGSPNYDVNHPGLAGFLNLRGKDITKSTDVFYSMPSVTPTTPPGTLGVFVEHSQDAKEKILDQHGITTLIEANNYIVKKMKSTENKFDPATWSTYDNFILALTADIKTSKMKYLQWAINVPFKFNANNAGSCVRTEKVTFRLRLFDAIASRNSKRTIAFPNNVSIGAPTSSVGTKLGADIAAPADSSYDASTGKWVYGTEAVLAKVKVSLSSAASLIVPVDQLLTGGEDTNFCNFGSGIAIPIINKNGDPRAWSPEFVNAKCGESKKIVEVNVLNPYFGAINKDETIYIIKKGNLWFNTTKPSENELGTVDNRWSFSYLMMNKDSYFRKVDINNGTTNTYSQWTVQEYQGAFKTFYTSSNSYVPDFATNTKKGGCNQITSFDFMDQHIGGTHPVGNTLLNTNFKIGWEGQELGDAGYLAFPFFGCVFPEGYDTRQKAKYFGSGGGVMLKPRNDVTLPAGRFFYHNLTSFGVTKYPFSAGRNINNGNANNLFASDGMFFKANTVGNPLIQLPADIALNASPSGTNGSPIKKVSMIPQIDIGDTFSNNFRYKIHSYLINEDRDTWLSQEEKFVSSFDFSPINSNKIQFRPLMLDVFGAINDTVAFTTNLNCPFESALRVNKLKVADLASRRVLQSTQNGSVGGKVFSDNVFKRIDSDPTGIQRYGNNLICGGHLLYPNNAPAVYDFKAFDLLWFNQPPQAVGVIGACCTKTAKNKIEFETSCHIGRVNIPIGQNAYPVWGASATPNALNTTCLFVRVFHQWPKEQTIFDPRFFAVFHFNDGIKEFKPDGTRKDIVSPQYTNGVKDFPINNLFLTPQNYPAGKYNVDDMMPGGFRVPTLHDKTTPIWVLGIMSDSHLFRDKKHWNVDNREVGVLLPYTGTRLTIGLHNFYIKSGGFGYKVGDEFSVVGGSGTGSKWKVTGATAIVAGGVGAAQGGQIISLDFVNSADVGRDYIPSDFLSNADIAQASIVNLDSSKFKIKLVSDTVNKSAVIYIVTGQTCYADNTISGPKEVQTPMLLSPETIPDDTKGKGVLTTTTQKAVILSSTNASPNRQYDIFFHFHNDVGHVFAHAPDLGSLGSNSEQQFIETSMSFT